VAALSSSGVHTRLPEGLSSLALLQQDERFTGDVRVQRQISAGEGSSTSDQALSLAPNPSPYNAPAFEEYHVLVEGETLGELAARYHVSVESIFWANDLGSSHVFAAGQELRIPRMAGIPYVIEQGDTIEAIAGRFHVQPEAIELFAPNGVHMDQPLNLGSEIFIPAGVQAYPEEFLRQHGGVLGIAGMRAVAAGMVQESETTLRAGPGREYPRLGYLDAGQRMKLIARHKAWVKVNN